MAVSFYGDGQYGLDEPQYGGAGGCEGSLEGPTSEGPTSDWVANSGAKRDCVAVDDGDACYIYTDADGAVQEFVWPATPVPPGRMVMAVRLVGKVRATVAGATVKLSIRRGVTSSDRRSDAPRETSFTLGTSYSEIAIVMSNKPFPSVHARANAWPADGSASDDYAFGIVSVDCAGGTIRCTELKLEVIVRPEITLAEIVSSERMIPWQWLEIEGIRYVFTTGAIPGSCGDYYYGFDHRSVAGVMLTNEMFRSGRLNRARGREEFESARVVLIDTSEVAYEHAADGGDAPVHLFSQGFLSWLLAYGDREHVAARRMLDSDVWNTLKGLDPQWTSGTTHYGRAFKVAPGATWPTPGGEDSYLFVGRECMWFGEVDPYPTYVVIGRADTDSKLLRGRFGSSNEQHEQNRVTGVYPEVTDHPASWNGRWVRIWTCYIDELTGYPFPMSLASARTYLWGSHTQEIGSARVCYTIMLDAIERVFDALVPRAKTARCRRIVMGPSSMGIWGIAVSDGKYYGWRVDLDVGSYDDVSALCSALQVGFATAGIADPLSIALVGDKVRVFIKPQLCEQWKLNCGSQIGSVLGFGTEVVDSSPDGTFEAAELPASVHCGSTIAYVEEGDTEDWPTGYILENSGRIPGTSGDFVVIVFVYGDHKTVRECISTLVGSDGHGHFLQHALSAPKSLQSFLPPASELPRSISGESPVTARLGLACVDVSIHEFFLRALLSTGFGVNGTWDVWPRGFGLAFPQALVDADTWELVGQEIKLRRSWFLLDSIKLSELLDEELAYPHGMMLRQDVEGRLQVTVSAPPSISDIVPEILDEHWTSKSSVREEHAARSVVNQVVIEIDEDPLDGKFRTKIETSEPNSIDRYGAKPLKLKHRGERARYLGSGIGAGAPAAYFPVLCSLLFQRFAFEQPVVSGSIGRHGFALLVADGIRFSHSLLQDVADRAERGIVERAGSVIKLDKNEVKGQCDIEIQYDRIVGKRGGYAPAAKVQSWDAGTKTATCYAHEFSSSSALTDPQRFAALDKAKLVQANDEDPSLDHMTISAVSGLTIVFSASPGFTPVDGDLIIWEDYGTLVTAQQAQGYVAVASGGFVDSGDVISAWEFSP